jgi:hypothetical protein
MPFREREYIGPLLISDPKEISAGEKICWVSNRNEDTGAFGGYFSYVITDDRNLKISSYVLIEGIGFEEVRTTLLYGDEANNALSKIDKRNGIITTKIRWEPR